MRRAQEILEAAECAISHGEPLSEVTILVGLGGTIRILMESDWPLDSLIAHHGGEAVYRVSSTGGMIRVEGRQAGNSYTLERRLPHRTAVRLFGLIG